MVEYGIKQTFGDNVTDTSTTLLNELNAMRFDGENIYRYVKFTDTTVATNIVSWVANGTAGTNDFTVVVGSATVTAPAGVAVSAHAADEYGWIQIAGVASCTGDGSIAALVEIISNGDGTAESWADGLEEQVMGIALEDDIAVTYAVQVRLKGLV